MSFCASDARGDNDFRAPMGRPAEAVGFVSTTNNRTLIIKCKGD
jgi:hypothetical protein